MDEESYFDYTIKYIIVDDAYVGKTNLLLHYTKGIFDEEYHQTLYIEYSNKVI